MRIRSFPRSLISLAILSVFEGAHAGGYVDGTQVLTQAKSIQLSGSTSSVTTFNNATLNDQNTIGEVHNDLIKTPSTSDPVSTVTGNNFHDETDLVIKGRGIDYAFTRTYNSAPSATKVNVGLGYGWVHSYGMRLKSNDYGACPNCTSAQDPVNGNGKTASITYTDERGGDHNYLVNESTYAVTPPQGEFDSLAFDTPAVGQISLTFRNGTKYIFETVGSGSLKTTPGLTARIKQIADPWGNQLNFTYDANGRLSKVADNLGIASRTGLNFTYDAAGQLKTLSDWSGRIWTYNVDASGNLLTATNALGQTLTYTYFPGSHNLNKIQKPLRGVQTAFVYYQNGRTFNYTDALGNVETLDYDLYRKTTRVTDPRGGIRSYEYDSSGRLNKLTEPDGAILMFQNQADGLRYSKTDGLGYQTQYSYRSDRSFNTASDTYGNVTREQNALNQTIDTSYGPYDQVASVKDKRGYTRTTSFHASTDGVCKTLNKPDSVTLSQLTAANGTIATNVKLASFCWNSDGSLKSQTEYLDSTGTKYRTTSYSYDAAHLTPLTITVTGSDGTSISKSYTYDSLGRTLSESLNRRTSPSNAATVALSTSYSYDNLGRITQVIDAIGNKLLTSYDANGQVAQITGQYKQADGSYVSRVLSTRYYDAADRLVQEVDAAGNAIRTAYDAAGNIISVTDRENHTTYYEYDRMNRRSAVIDANGNRSTISFDLAGHAVLATNGAGESSSVSYDKLGRAVQSIDPQGNTTLSSYDANNNLTCLIDANAQAGLQSKNADGCTVSTVYDELNRPIKVKDALNGLTQTSYDLLGNVLAITDASSKTTSYTYDALGRLKQTTDPLNKSTLVQRDEAGNIWQVTNRLGQVTNTTYDLLNRAVGVSYVTDGTSESYSYDPYGNLLTSANGNVTYTYSYDALNRMLSKLDSRSGRRLSFSYDRVGNILTKTDYQNATTTYTYDSANQRVAMRNPAYLEASYQHDSAGRLLARILSDGARTLYTWNSSSQLTSLKTYTANGTLLSNTSYSRDRLGNVLGQSDASGSTSFTYDPLYRLKSADYPGTANDESFTYDAVGNRLTHTLAGVTRAYEYWPSSNRIKALHTSSLTGAIERSYTFDDEGRLTAETGPNAKTLTWDQKNRAKTTVAGSNSLSFAYDTANYRIGRSGGSLGSRDYYLEGEHLEAEYSGGAIQSQYFRGLTTDELVAGFSYDATGKWQPAIYHHDLLMSVTGISTHDGTTQQTASYSPFGDRLITATGTSTNRLKYTGREQDSDTGLYYYRARYYDPVIGRFVSEDPKGLTQGPNIYVYVGNCPTTGNDPSGMDNFLYHGIQAFQAGYKSGMGFWDAMSYGVDVALFDFKTQSGSNPNAFVQNMHATGGINVTGVPQTDAERQTGILQTLNDPTSSLSRLTLPTTPYSILVAKGHGASDFTNDVHRSTNYGGISTNSIGDFLSSIYEVAKHFIVADTIDPLFNWNQRVENITTAIQATKTGQTMQGDFSTGRLYIPTDSNSNQAANGGFMLYPNKSNTNQLQTVYGK